MRRTLARWLAAGLLGVTLALGGIVPTWFGAVPAALAADPGGHTGGGG
jgi:hypothetical protein